MERRLAWILVAVGLLVGACTPTSPRSQPQAQPQPPPHVADDAPIDPPRARAIAVVDDELLDEAIRGREYLARTEWTEAARDDTAFSCKRDRDCELVRMDCCDRCNGGWELAVNVDRIEEVRARYSALDCTHARCTLVYCGHETTVVCDDGMCARRLVPRKHLVAEIAKRELEHGSNGLPSRSIPRILRNRVPPTVSAGH